MDDIIGPLIVAAISAITFVAYKHHEAYRRIDMVITFTMIVVAVGVLSFWGGAIYGIEVSRPHFDADSATAGRALRDQLASNMSTITWSLAGITAYNFLLSALPKILGLKKDQAKDK